MAENACWKIFLGMLCNYQEITKESVLYKFIIEKFPIQFMQKLVSTAVDENSTQRYRDYAAGVITDMNDENLLERNSSKIDPPTLDSLRRNALDLTVGYEVGSVLQMCGDQMAFQLLRQSLTSAPIWDGFLEFAEEAFTSTSADGLLRFLAIFHGLPPLLRDRLVIDMKPRITRKIAEFEARVVQLLHEAHDATPFLILPCIIRAFDQTISPAITQAAIVSQFLADVSHTSPWIVLIVADIVAYCVENTILTDPPFSIADFAIMEGTASRLATFLEESAIHVEYVEVALRLVKALVLKFRAYYPPDLLIPSSDEEE